MKVFVVVVGGGEDKVGGCFVEGVGIGFGVVDFGCVGVGRWWGVGVGDVEVGWDFLVFVL